MNENVAAEAADIDRAITGTTLLTQFENTARSHGDAVAHRWKVGNEWRELTWSQYREQVRHATAGLKAIGFQAGEFGLIMARNRSEHLVADLAIVHARGVPVSVYNTLAPDQVQYIAQHCEGTVAVLEDAGFYSKFAAVRDQLPRLRTIVVINPDGVPLSDSVISWEDLLARGAEADRKAPDAFEDWRQVGLEDLGTLIYTSGTTGPPQAVMLTQRNLMWMGESADRYLHQEGLRLLSYLPFAHIFERFVGHYQAIRGHAVVSFCPETSQLGSYLVEVRPTAMIGVPRVWEKLHTGLSAGIAAESDEQRRGGILKAIEVGRQLVKLEQAGQQPPPELLAAAEQCRPVWMAIRSKVGLDQCEWGITGAAPINVEVIEFFQALGLKLWEGWGMSETSVGGTHNPLTRIKNGTVGKRNPGVEFKLGEDGELLMRGGNVFKGYYKDPEKTAETIDEEGWLHTGDVAEIDADGYVKLIDRKKELIITAGGKNISPANLEALLKEHPLVGQAAAIGDRRPYISALIVLDQEVAPIWAQRAGIEGQSLAELAVNPTVREAVAKAVESVNARVSNVEGIKRFTILPVEWTAESEELTPTLKLKRRVIFEKYAAEIEEMYRREEPRPAEASSTKAP